MGAAVVGEPVRLAAGAAHAAEPAQFVWRIVGPQGETVLAGRVVSFTPLAPAEHAVSVEVHDGYDRSARAEARLPVALA